MGQRCQPLHQLVDEAEKLALVTAGGGRRIDKGGAEEKVSLHCRTEAAEGGQLSAQLAVTAAIGRLQAAQQILCRTADSLLSRFLRVILVLSRNQQHFCFMKRDSQ